MRTPLEAAIDKACGYVPPPKAKLEELEDETFTAGQLFECAHSDAEKALLALLLSEVCSKSGKRALSRKFREIGGQYLLKK